MYKTNDWIVGGKPNYGPPGGQIPTFLPKLTPNTSIMQITSQFGPFDNVSNHKKQSMMVFEQN